MVLGLAKSTCLCFIIVINLIFVFAMVHRVRKPFCEPNFLCSFVLRNTSGPNVKFVDS